MATRGRRHIGVRPTNRRRKVRAGAALFSGVWGAALFVAAAPLALAGNTSTISTAPADFPSSSTKAPSGIGQMIGPCFGTGNVITEVLSGASIVANGTSTSTATATVMIGDTFCNRQQVVFSSSDSRERVSATTDHGDGTYTATITSSRRAGQARITAALTVLNSSPQPAIVFRTATATLSQTAGPAARIVLVMPPASVPADGTSTSQGTATVTDANGNAVVGDFVSFSTSDPSERFSAVTGHGDGSYTITITSSTTPETATISTVDSSVEPSLTAHAPLTQTAVAIAVPAAGAAVGQPDTVGCGLVALGTGLLARAGRRTRI